MKKYNNQVTEYISNTDSASFISALGYKILGVTKGKTRDDDKFRLIDETKGYSKPFSLYRRHFLQQADRYRLHIVKVVKTQHRESTNACEDYDLFNYGVL